MPETEQLSGPAVEAWIDRYVEGRMRTYRIPGAAVSVALGPKPLLSRGYGLSDVESGQSVEAGETLFRVASLSKLFTAVATLQLLERGQLAWDSDIGASLKRFQLRGRYKTPVTVRHLLTHTAGLDERLIGVSTRDRRLLAPLGDYLARAMPPRVLPAGRTSAYSNHGFALLGHLIELASGMSFVAYMHSHVLEPLGMHSSSFGPLESRPARFATGHQLYGNDLRPVPFDDYTHIPPAGGLLTTAQDMARFLLAMLNVEDVRSFILTAESLQTLHSQQHVDHLLLPGIACSFFESRIQGQRILSHTGGAQGYGSVLFLLPEARAGIFLVANRLDEGLLYDLPRQFVLRFFPERVRPEPDTDPEPPGRLVHYLGAYRHNRYARTSLEKIMALQGELQVGLDRKESLVLQYQGGFRAPLQQIGRSPRLFRRSDGALEAGFREDGRGRVSHLFLSSAGMTQVYERLRWFETLRFQAPLTAVLLLSLLASAVGGAWAWIQEPTLVAAFAGLASLTSLGFSAGMVLVLREVVRDYWRFGYGLPPSIRFLLRLPYASILLTLSLAIFFLFGMAQGPASLDLETISASIALLSNLGFLSLLKYWNLIGVRT